VDRYIYVREGKGSLGNGKKENEKEKGREKGM
jgi:hypothetical protein